MGRLRLVALLAIAASCVPDETTIGTTAWVIPKHGNTARVGRGGHLVVSTDLVPSTLEVNGPDGVQRWTMSGIAGIMDVDIAADGSVVLAQIQPGPTRGPLTLERYAPDGTLAWRKSFPDAPVKTPGDTSVVIDSENAAWVIFDADAPTDLGGGPIGDTTPTMRWGRFAADGAYLASGVFPFNKADEATAVPSGGIALLAANGILAFDTQGQQLWFLPVVMPNLFVVHDDDSVTVQTLSTLFRYDVARNERWQVARRQPTPFAATSDGGVIFVEPDAIGDATEPDISVLIHATADGAFSREIMTTSLIGVVPGAPSSQYILSCGAPSRPNQTVDLNDRTVKGPSFAARQL